ncbi:hypothetical protein CFC21_069101 [Triticum aestivum]|uniref:F-box domain-containing protein n=3 Tax=Triticum TaxID=4564 RepID=A0A9R0WVZ0_TRITD|nr:hypothetical protein CFC21_069101 [Triticum aestivum]VAI25424.1 unnamed protein product [Triticum turgidum subsp. durum]
MDANDDANGFCFPYDVLLEILHRLPARALADSRRVCHAWRTIIDAHSLLLPHAFPREFPGIYTIIYYGFTSDSALFVRPMSQSDEPGYRRPFSWGDWGMCTQQHCNGLFLVRDSYHLEYANEMYACNPTTVRAAHLPRPPTPWPCNVEGMFLAFDPAMSRYHKVFLLPSKKVPYRWFTEKEQWDLEEEESYGFASQFGELDGKAIKMLPLLVFSSQTGQWEDKKFAPGRCAPGHIYDVVTTPRGFKRLAWSAEYWHGSLYVHCHSGVLLILRCSEGVYDMVQLPGDLAPYDDEEDKESWDLPKRSVLASYERGVCYVTLNKYHLMVWALIESTDGQLEWTLAHEADLRPHSRSMESLKRKARPRMKMEWELVETDEKLISLSGQSSNEEIDEDHDTGEEEYNEGEVEEVERSSEEDDKNDDIGEESNDDEAEELGSGEGSVYSWNSDEHNFIDLDESDTTDLEGYLFRIIGLHPHKDVLLLNFCSCVVAYHLGTSRMQYLGHIFPKQLTQNAANVRCAFPYRPCYFDALPQRKSQPS